MEPLKKFWYDGICYDIVEDARGFYAYCNGHLMDEEDTDVIYKAWEDAVMMLRVREDERRREQTQAEIDDLNRWYNRQRI